MTQAGTPGLVQLFHHVPDLPGFIEAKLDTSQFISCHDPNTVYLLLYVDDIILTVSSMELLHHTISALQREFAMKDLMLLHHFLSITVERCPGGLFHHQRTYMMGVIKRATMVDCKLCTSPVDPQAKLAVDSGPPI
jgi:hypothetical protein